jgi:SAM-dependent methyltransferase
MEARMRPLEIARRLFKPSAYSSLWRRRAHHAASEYAERLVEEERFYSACETVNDLPGIFHYWSDKYIRPKLEQLGASHPEDFFAKRLEMAYQKSRRQNRVFLSIGAGNCDTETRLAQWLKQNGCTEFSIECLEMNKQMLARGSACAQAAGVAEHLDMVSGDFNTWQPTKSYDAVIANQSLHHVLNLEGLFRGIAQSLEPTGQFLTSDIMGRNGHMRWPEALAIVQEYWRELPAKYRYNNLLRRLEESYQNWDCSTEGFEGIRAQEILPLLIEHFSFDEFLGFANVIDPFVDRAIGPNFDAGRRWDCEFIDRVHARDEIELAAGHVKPTHIIAALCVGRSGENRTFGGMTPESCVRAPG